MAREAGASSIELILDKDDCLLCGGLPDLSVTLGGAYVGSLPTYDLPVRVPALAIDQRLLAVGVPCVPVGFDVNRFTYGNFGDPGQFGLDS